MNIQAMMKQAQQMQERLQKQMAELRIEATAGGGMVTVTVNGAKQVLALKIDPEVVSKDDVEMLQDLILAAVNDGDLRCELREECRFLDCAVTSTNHDDFLSTEEEAVARCAGADAVADEFGFAGKFEHQ